MTVVIFIAYMFIWKVPSRRKKDQLFYIDDMAEEESYDSAKFIEVMATDESDGDYDEFEEYEDDPEDHPQIFDEEDDDPELEGTIEAMSNEVAAEEETPSGESVPDKKDTDETSQDK